MLEFSLWTALLGGIIHMMNAATHLAHRTFLNTFIRAHIAVQTISGAFRPTYTIDATPATTVAANATPSPTATCSAWTLLYRDPDLDNFVNSDYWKCSASLQAFVAPELPFGLERFRQLLLPYVAKAQAIMDRLDPEMRLIIAYWLVAVVAIGVLVVARKVFVAYTSRKERSESLELTIPGLDISYTTYGMDSMSLAPYTQQDFNAFVSESASDMDMRMWLTAAAPSASSDLVLAGMDSPDATVDDMTPTTVLSPSLTSLASPQEGDILNTSLAYEALHPCVSSPSALVLSDIGNDDDVGDPNEFIPAEITATSSVVDHTRLTSADADTPSHDACDSAVADQVPISVEVAPHAADSAAVPLLSSSVLSVSGALATGDHATVQDCALDDFPQETDIPAEQRCTSDDVMPTGGDATATELSPILTDDSDEEVFIYTCAESSTPATGDRTAPTPNNAPEEVLPETTIPAEGCTPDDAPAYPAPIFVEVAPHAVDPATVPPPSSSVLSESGAPATGDHATTAPDNALDEVPQETNPSTAKESTHHDAPTNLVPTSVEVAPHAVDPASVPLLSSSVLLESGAPATGDHAITVQDSALDEVPQEADIPAEKGMSDVTATGDDATATGLPSTLADDEEDIFIYTGADSMPSSPAIAANVTANPVAASSTMPERDPAPDTRDEVVEAVPSNSTVDRSLSSSMHARKDTQDEATTSAGANSPVAQSSNNGPPVMDGSNAAAAYTKAEVDHALTLRDKFLDIISSDTTVDRSLSSSMHAGEATKDKATTFAGASSPAALTSNGSPVMDASDAAAAYTKAEVDCALAIRDRFLDRITSDSTVDRSLSSSMHAGNDPYDEDTTSAGAHSPVVKSSSSNGSSVAESSHAAASSTEAKSDHALDIQERIVDEEPVDEEPVDEEPTDPTIDHSLHSRSTGEEGDDTDAATTSADDSNVTASSTNAESERALDTRETIVDEEPSEPTVDDCSLTSSRRAGNDAEDEATTSAVTDSPAVPSDHDGSPVTENSNGLSVVESSNESPLTESSNDSPVIETPNESPVITNPYGPPVIESSNGSPVPDKRIPAPIASWTSSQFAFKSDLSMPAGAATHGWATCPIPSAAHNSFSNPSSSGPAWNSPVLPQVQVPHGPAQMVNTPVPTIAPNFPSHLSSSHMASGPTWDPGSMYGPTMTLPGHAPSFFSHPPLSHLATCRTWNPFVPDVDPSANQPPPSWTQPWETDPETRSDPRVRKIAPMPRRKPYLERFKERLNDVPIDRSSDPDDSSSGPHSHRLASAAETSLGRDIGTSRREGTEDLDEPTTTRLDKGKQRDYGDSERQEQEQQEQEQQEQEQEQLDEIDEAILQAIADTDNEDQEGESKPSKKKKRKQNKKRNRRKCRNPASGRSEEPEMEASTSRAAS